MGGGTGSVGGGALGEGVRGGGGGQAVEHPGGEGYWLGR